jgi:hypothetical protein
MYVNWPASVLSHPGFEQVLDPDTGLPLFRDPRLRMGLAEGQPNSGIPDHNGRANYWGSCVNRCALGQQHVHCRVALCVQCLIPMSTGAGRESNKYTDAAGLHCACIA